MTVLLENFDLIRFSHACSSNREYARGVVLRMRKLTSGKVLGYGRCSVVFSCTIVAYSGFVLVLHTGI